MPLPESQTACREASNRVVRTRTADRDGPDNDRGRPPAKEAASNVISDGDKSSVARSTDVLADLDALAEHLRGYFVVQVVVDDAGHRRTYIYRTTAAAERAVERARARGRHATITLCQLHPVGVVAGVVR